MLTLPFADSFQAGAVLTLALPLALLIAIAVWYVFAVRRVPSDTPTTSATLPPSEVVDAAGPDAVAEVTLEADVSPIDPRDDA